MKKNKTSMYLLLPIVIGIWAYIGWKIYDGLAKDEPVSFTALPQKTGGPGEIIPDTFQVRADYRDPFLGKAQYVKSHEPGTGSPPANKKTAQTVPPPQVAKNWPVVVYGGMMQKKQGPVFALLNVNGVDHLVKAGEKAGDVQVQAIFRDSIQLAWGKEKRFFRK